MNRCNFHEKHLRFSAKLKDQKIESLEEMCFTITFKWWKTLLKWPGFEWYKINLTSFTSEPNINISSEKYVFTVWISCLRVSKHSYFYLSQYVHNLFMQNISLFGLLTRWLVWFIVIIYLSWVSWDHSTGNMFWTTITSDISGTILEVTYILLRLLLLWFV